MKLRSMLLLALAAASLSSLSAVAHPQGHDDEKAIPRTCAELTDTRRFTDDTTYPEVKALKTRCDAEQKSAPKKPEAKPANDKKN